jgi:hypothetical protein
VRPTAPHQNPIAQNFLLFCSLAADKTALVVAGFYWFHLPPAPVGQPSNSSFTPAGILVNDIEGSVLLSKKPMFRRLFSRKDAPLAGTPAVPRLKTYSARSGYVYQYRYQGNRPLPAGPDSGVEFVFSVSADRKSWHDLGVVVSDGAIRAWEEAHARELTSAERHAIAKMALFQAFDERPTPALMKEQVRVRPADVEAISETLDL